GRDGFVQIWDLAAGKECSRSPVHPGRVWQVAFAPDGRTLATTSDGDSKVRIWDVATGLPRRAFSFDVVALFGMTVAFSPDGKRIAVGGSSKTSGRKSRTSDGDIIGIWDINGGDPLIIRNAHE